MAYSNGNHRKVVVRGRTSMIRAFSKYGWIFISAITFGVVSLLWPALTLEGLAGLLVCIFLLLGSSIGAMLWDSAYKRLTNEYRRK